LKGWARELWFLVPTFRRFRRLQFFSDFLLIHPTRLQTPTFVVFPAQACEVTESAIQNRASSI
jgi:hypothetical protein